MDSINRYTNFVESCYATDPRTTTELLDVALSDPTMEDEAAWKAIGILQFRGSEEEFELAKRLLQSSTLDERLVGVHILGRLGWSDYTFRDESVALLIEQLNDPVEDVIAAVTVALGHRHDARAIPDLVIFKSHPNVDIRDGVVFGLLGYEEQSAISALVALSKDEDEEVRDWATFGLGNLIDVDTPELREALVDRLEDENPEIRGEAFIGLAKRHDERVRGPLERELRGDFYGDWSVEAAQLLEDSTLCPLLLNLYERLDDQDKKAFRHSFEKAIAACCPNEDKNYLSFNQNLV